QGAPFHHFGKRLHLGYEWNFGIAFGWHHAPMPEWSPTAWPISTAVTAHMGVALKLNYDLTSRWSLSMALRGVHHSNGNTSWRNAGMNAAGLSVGITYIINPMADPSNPPESLIKEADAKKWFYDLMVFGAWRRRVVYLPDSPFLDELDRNDALAPKKYPVFGMQFAPAITLNRWVAVGPALDVQWDKSCDLATHWIEQPIDDAIEFTPVPFKDQVSVGVSAHAELTTPIFAINAGVGLNVINPKGDQRFYQSLAVKAFLSSHLYLNIGYRLGSFKTPQHLMLGVGYRFR
ncbi:MAG: acyloxyacyl hydrolase, partial [Muribaculaceae bacterium]|nr:acyloxyacyl hydrolase [Muribaculaceae bacterium]